MKEQKGFASFLGEEKKKPAKKKTKSKSAGIKRKADKGKDDAKYIALMDEYKRTRGRDTEMANKIHKQSMDLDRDGDVSDRAHEVVRYL